MKELPKNLRYKNRILTGLWSALSYLKEQSGWDPQTTDIQAIIDNIQMETEQPSEETLITRTTLIKGFQEATKYQKEDPDHSGGLFFLRGWLSAHYKDIDKFSKECKQ